VRLQEIRDNEEVGIREIEELLRDEQYDYLVEKILEEKNLDKFLLTEEILTSNPLTTNKQQLNEVAFLFPLVFAAMGAGINYFQKSNRLN